MLREVLEAAVGQHIPLEEEGWGWEECLEVPVGDLGGRSFQRWLLGLPIRHGGLGLTSQEELSPLAFIGTLEQALPFYGGESGVCPTLAHLVGNTAETRYAPLLASGCRTGVELRRAWEAVQGEAREACEFLGRELEGPLAATLEGLGEGSTTGATRKLLSKAREELRLDVFERSISLQAHNRARGLSSWKERDKLCTAFLLSTPGPHSSLSSPVFAEAMATLLSLPSRACMDRLGERVGGSRVDRFGERIILEVLPGGH